MAVHKVKSPGRPRLSRTNAAPFLPLFERARPIGAEKARERAIGQQSSAGLAAGAVVGLVLGIHDALHRRSTHGTGLLVTAVHRHLGAKGGHALGKIRPALRAQTLGPLHEHGARSLTKTGDLLIRQLAREDERRQTRAMQDLVRIGVADSRKEAGIGERTLERVALAG